MSQKSDYFFLNIKQVYPNFARPSALETEIWEEMLEPYTQGDILAGIKSYRKSEDTNFAPNPARFRSYLYSRAKKAEKPCLPLFVPGAAAICFRHTAKRWNMCWKLS